MQERVRIKENSGIYKILNTSNNKVYIGSSYRLHQRFIKHKNDLICNKHANKHLQSSYNKYGSELFVFDILEDCDISRFNELEQFYVDKYKSNCVEFGYNKREIVESNRGYSFEMPEYAKAILREKGKIRGATKEFKDFMSSVHKNKIVSESTRRKSSISHTGNKMSDETKKKISENSSRRVHNVDSGISYKNINDCCVDLHMSRATFHNWMNGNTKKKKYKLIYI